MDITVSMKKTNRKVIIVLIEYMIPGPSTERTAFKSLVMRDMISPVGISWKNRAESF